jgi:hypothetical protein
VQLLSRLGFMMSNIPPSYDVSIIILFLEHAREELQARTPTRFIISDLEERSRLE